MNDNIINKLREGGNMFKINDGICDICGKKICYSHKGKIIQPCAVCDTKAKNDQYFKEIKKSSLHSEIDEKYQTCSFADYELKNEGQRRVLNQCKEFVWELQAGKWCVMHGRQGTGKTMLKNCIMKEMIKTNTTFRSITGMKLYDDWRDLQTTNANESSFSKIIKDYCKADLLIIDEFGRFKESPSLHNFIFRIVDEIYRNKKSLMIITNLNPTDSSGVSLESFIDLERLREQAIFMRFDWESHRGKRWK